MPSDPAASQPVLSPADHDHFIEHGYVVVKRAVPVAVIEAAVAALDAGTPEGVVGTPTFKPVTSDTVNACATERFAHAVGELFGEPYPMRPGMAGQDMPRVPEPNAKWDPGAGVHLDDDYPTLLPNHWAVGAFLFLTPVRTKGGAFVFCPGSPRRLLAVAATNPDTISYVVRAPPGAPVCGAWTEHLAEPGDLLLFHHLMAHTGSPNVSDPRTRHALLSRHHPRRRVVPGEKPVEQMSTVEKANSVRFLRHRFGDAPAARPADDPRADALLSGGMLPLGVQPACAAAMYREGCPHLFLAGAGWPGMMSVLRSRNWVDWEAFGEVALPGVGAPAAPKVRAIHLHAAPEGAGILATCGGPGADQPAVTYLLRSADWRTWTVTAELPGIVACAAHHTTQFGNAARVNGRVIVESVAGDPGAGAIRSRLGPAWSGVADWPEQGSNIHLVDGAPITGLELKPTLGEGEFALLLDAEGRGLAYRESKDCLRFEGETKGLPCPPGARHVRVMVRGRRFWLVTYLAPPPPAAAAEARTGGGGTGGTGGTGGERLFWGAIDWEDPPPRLRCLATRDELHRALALVGLV